jgi:EAL domain-containing protein (putative c-di-GMP-specific phosphodiesterase class I)
MRALMAHLRAEDQKRAAAKMTADTRARLESMATEYAESEEIIELLRALGVDYAQGYGVAMPEKLTAGEGWASHLA